MTNSVLAFRKGSQVVKLRPLRCLGCAATHDAAPLIEDVLATGGLSVLHSDLNLGKSFFALDLAWHVATGQAWRGCQVDGGPVVYFALEGTFGIENRLYALKRRSALPPGDVPFTVIPMSLDLLAEADVIDVIKLLRLRAKRWGAPVRLMVVDTLARAIGGFDENSSADMGKLIRHLDRRGRDVTTCVVQPIDIKGTVEKKPAVKRLPQAPGGVR